MERSKADYTVDNRYITDEMYVTEKYSILYVPRYITRKLIASHTNINHEGLHWTANEYAENVGSVKT